MPVPVPVPAQEEEEVATAAAEVDPDELAEMSDGTMKGVKQMLKHAKAFFDRARTGNFAAQGRLMMLANPEGAYMSTPRRGG